MKSPTIVLLVVVLLIAGCASANLSRKAENTAAPSAAPAMQAEQAQRSLMQPVSLSDADKSAANSNAFERKIIRNADLTVEVTSPSEVQRQIASIVASHGGFVVNSETKQRDDADPARKTLDIKLILRVPSNQFDPALNDIESLANNIVNRTISGEDVTEEFIDLEARIKTQKALELQFLEIMKQAAKVADALEVQRQIAEVRTEIEKLEGRKRFLENRAALSTITVNIQAPRPLAVSTSGFGRELRQAISDSTELAVAIVLFFVRLVILMLPVLLFVILPATLVARSLLRRAKRVRLAQELQNAASSS